MAHSADQSAQKLLTSARHFLDHHSTEPEIQRSFGYFTRHPVAPLNRKRLIAMLKEIQATSTRLGRPLRVLDLACGGGIITCAVADLGHRVLGVDLSREEISLAQRFAREESLGGNFWQADLLADSFWERTAEETLGGKPDVMILAYALHHLPQVEYFLDRLSRWLDPGAILLINEENPSAPLFRLKHLVRGWIQKDTDVEWHRTYEGWTKLLQDKQFDVSTPTGLDPIGLTENWDALRCWSLVFTAARR